MVRAEKIIMNKTNEINGWLNEATSIYNQALYYLRQEYFNAQKEKRKPDYSKINLYDTISKMDIWKKSTLDSVSKTYVLRKVKDNWTVFYKSCKAYWKNKDKFLGKPKILNYLKNGKTTILIFDKTRLRKKNIKENTLSLPKSKSTIKIPKFVPIQKIRCITVKSYYGKVKLSISYEKELNDKVELNKDNAIGIDIGVDNIVSITANNQNKSWIVKGGIIKSINQFYNKRLSEMKSVLEKTNKRKSSKAIDKLNMKRKQRIDYEFHCLSKKIIRLCLENNIGKIVIGHNSGWKQNSNIGKTNNQNFVQIPFNDLIFKIQYKAEENRIDCILTKESYTSKIDHCVNESLYKHDEYLGKRIKRGLFKSSCGKVLNADINGAIGILRKINVFPDARLNGLRNRGDVVSPLVLKYKP